MANQLPEVMPEVQSMPTTGWFCQTGGGARRRITPNTSTEESRGIFDVKGLPGHTHNSSAIISVDADYTEYRESTITVAENVWAVGAITMPLPATTNCRELPRFDARALRDLTYS